MGIVHRAEWIQARKSLLRQVQLQVQLHLGPQPKKLRKYAESLEKEFNGRWWISSVAELINEMRSCRLILGADFHAYSQSQRAHLRMMRELVKHGHPLAIGLEAISAEHQGVLNKYLEARVTESTFLHQIEWQKRWGFPFENYRPILEFARQNGLPVRALNHPQARGLAARDVWMAKEIKKYLKNSDESQSLYVVVGEWHLAKAHLPGRLRERGLQADDIMTILQDSERLFFKGLGGHQSPASSVDVWRSRERRYCLMVSPPWMKWQSYAMYLESLSDQDLDADQTGLDSTEHVAQLIRILDNDFGFKTDLSRLQVFGSESEGSLKRLFKSAPRSLLTVLKYHVASDLSFYLPEKDWLYLSRHSINHAATLAGQYVHGHLCGRRRALWNMPDDFRALIWVEAIGFYLSKMINPKRKSESLRDIRLELEALSPRDKGYKSLLLAMDHRLSEVLWIRTGRKRSVFARRFSWRVQVDAARVLGRMLGEKIFIAFTDGKITTKQVRKWMSQPIDSSGFDKLYWQTIQLVDDGR